MACTMAMPRNKRANGSTTLFRTCALGLLLGWLSASTTAATELTGFHASYEVRNAAMTLGTIERTLRDNGGQYLYQSVTTSTGLAALLKKQRTTERSTFSYDGSTPVAQLYQYHRQSDSKERTRETQFDWESGEAHSTADGKSFVTPLTAGVSDPLLYQIALMVDLANQRQELRYDIADRGRLKEYRFGDLGEQRVETPAGEFIARVVRREKGANKGSATFWCAAQLNYLPVRVDLIDDDGDTTTAQLTEYRLCGADQQDC